MPRRWSWRVRFSEGSEAQRQGYRIPRKDCISRRRCTQVEADTTSVSQSRSEIAAPAVDKCAWAGLARKQYGLFVSIQLEKPPTDSDMWFSVCPHWLTPEIHLNE